MQNYQNVFSSQQRDLLKCKILPDEFINCFTTALKNKKVTNTNCFQTALDAQMKRSKFTQSANMGKVAQQCMRAGELEVVFVIDGSGSVGRSTFNQQIQLLRALVKHMDVGPQATRVALMQYAHGNRVEFNFVDNHSTLDHRLSNVRYMNGGTQTGKAIRDAYSQIIQRYRRRDAGVAMVVITDGESGDDVLAPSNEMRAQDIVMTAVGYAGFKRSELDEIANDPNSEYVFSGNKMSDLLRLKEKISVAICDINKCNEMMVKFEEQMRSYKEDMENALNLYNQEVQLIDQSMASLDEQRKEFKENMKERSALIKALKKEKMEKRTKLLQLQENQIRGKRVALVLKRDMERNMVRFDSITDTLQLTQLALKEVHRALRSNYRSLQKFNVQLNNLKNDIQGQVKDFEDIERRIGKGRSVNPYLIKSELKTIYVDNMKSGVGMVVLSQMYDAIYTYMSELDEFPVGLYDPDLSLKQNVRRFQKFVQKMNNQKLGVDTLDDELKKVQEKISSINGARTSGGLDAASSCSVSKDVKDISQITKECSADGN